MSAKFHPHCLIQHHKPPKTKSHTRQTILNHKLQITIIINDKSSNLQKILTTVQNWIVMQKCGRPTNDGNDEFDSFCSDFWVFRCRLGQFLVVRENLGLEGQRRGDELGNRFSSPRGVCYIFGHGGKFFRFCMKKLFRVRVILWNSQKPFFVISPKNRQNFALKSAIFIAPVYMSLIDSKTKKISKKTKRKLTRVASREAHFFLTPLARRYLF